MEEDGVCLLTSGRTTPGVALPASQTALTFCDVLSNRMESTALQDIAGVCCHRREFYSFITFSAHGWLPCTDSVILFYLLP